MMGRMLRHVSRLTLLVLVVVGVAGISAACSGADPGDSGDSRDSRQELERQRTDVRASTRAAVQAVSQVLGGTLRNSSGKYDGCRGAGIDQYDSFQYTVRGRIDVSGLGVGRPYLDQVGDALTGAGLSDLEPGTRSGGTTLGARDGAVEVRLSEFPELGDYLIIDVLGPCVDTPTGDTDYWIGIRADKTLED